MLNNIFKTKTQKEPGKDLVAFFQKENATHVVQIDNTGTYINVLPKLEIEDIERFAISKEDLNKAKGIFAEPKISIKGSKLTIKEGKMKVVFNLITEFNLDYPDVKIENKVELPLNFIKAIKSSKGFVNPVDKTPAKRSIIFNNEGIYATSGYEFYYAQWEKQTLAINAEYAMFPVDAFDNFPEAKYLLTGGRFTVVNENEDKIFIASQVDGDIPKVSEMVKRFKDSAETALLIENNGEFEKVVSSSSKLGHQTFELKENGTYTSSDVDKDNGEISRIEVELGIKFGQKFRVAPTQKLSIVQNGKWYLFGDGKPLVVFNENKTEMALTLPLKS